MTFSEETDGVVILYARCLTEAVGSSTNVERRPSAILQSLLSMRRADRPDAWFIIGNFDDARRTMACWNSSAAVTLDFDHEDPELSKSEGAHQPLPASKQEELLDAMKSYRVPGLAYMTHRGVRLVHVLTQDVRDPSDYEDLAECASAKFLRHLESCGVATWRQGSIGLRYDSTSGRPSQPMRLPLDGKPCVACGKDRAVSRAELLNEGCPRLDLDAALPAELAETCRAIGDGLQIAPEVFVTGLMANASAMIGNTRWIQGFGPSIPLSLHYLTIQPSGTGKSTARGFLREALAGPEAEVHARREEALAEEAEYQERLAKHRQVTEKSKSVKEQAERPVPHPRSPRGGTRATLIITGGTIEGIIDTLIDNPRGVLWSCNEAHQVIGSLGRYSDGASARSQDAAILRGLMESELSENHRARSNHTPIRSVKHPWISIDADVQPGVVAKLFNGEDLVSGMSARWLVHQPLSMRGKRRYVHSPAQPGERELSILRRYLEPLWRIELELVDGQPVPRILKLDEDAQRMYAIELERMESCYDTASEPLAAALGHARGRLLRFGGNLALLRDPATLVVSGIDMTRAIEHMRYHLAHAERLFDGDELSEFNRLEQLEKRAGKILEGQPKKGVTPRCLARRVNKARYSGDAGKRRAIADLNSIGWTPHRQKSKGTGRRPQPGWFPTPASTQSTKQTDPDERSRFADSAECSRANSGWKNTAAEILERASVVLLERGEVVLPTKGLRGPCPICRSGDGLGQLPDEPTRWYCHSDKHQAGGCAVDLLLGEKLGRAPTPAEAVEEAKRVLSIEEVT